MFVGVGRETERKLKLNIFFLVKFEIKRNDGKEKERIGNKTQKYFCIWTG